MFSFRNIQKRAGVKHCQSAESLVFFLTYIKQPRKKEKNERNNQPLILKCPLNILLFFFTVSSERENKCVSSVVYLFSPTTISIISVCVILFIFGLKSLADILVHVTKNKCMVLSKTKNSFLLSRGFLIYVVPFS